MKDDYLATLKAIWGALSLIALYMLSQWLYAIINAGTCKALFIQDILAWIAQAVFCL